MAPMQHLHHLPGCPLLLAALLLWAPRGGAGVGDCRFLRRDVMMCRRPAPLRCQR